MAKRRYYKCNAEGGFSCANSGLRMTKQNEVAYIDSKPSDFINSRCRGGHIVEVDESAYNKWMSSNGGSEVFPEPEAPSQEPEEASMDFSQMTKGELVDFLYNLEENDMTKGQLKKLSQEDLAEMAENLD